MFMAQQDCLDCQASQVFPAMLERRALEEHQELPVQQVKKNNLLIFKCLQILNSISSKVRQVLLELQEITELKVLKEVKIVTNSLHR